MPETDSYPFTMYSGLLEPEHYKKIGNAIWLFLWFVSTTTSEKTEEGSVRGIVLGGRPIALPELAERFGIDAKTISRWVKSLETNGYIQTKRAPRGIIFTVQNSKKFRKRSDKNVPSERSERTEMSDQNESDRTFLSLRSDRIVRSNKDITKILSTTITDDELFSKNPPVQQHTPFIKLLNAYCELHGKIDFHVKPKEREAMGKMVAGDMPLSFTIPTMELLYQEKRRREGQDFKPPSSFLYYVDGIEQAWQNTQPVKMTGGRSGKTNSKQPALTKQQQELANLRKRAEEARRNGQSRSV